MRSACLLFLLVTSAASAQTQTVLFPGQSGATLLASIRAAYRPTSITGDNDDLYSVIDRTTVGGQSGVVCVYTGLFVPFDGQGPNGPTTDPSTDVGNGFSPTGVTINQEHTWPNSLLDNFGDQDLHNLYPTQVGVNAYRDVSPFGEVPDAQATEWYRGAPPYVQTTVPMSNIDEYSEIQGSRTNAAFFEPREDHKGNVARSLFYMRAVHNAQTSNASPSDFSFTAEQQRTLLGWHRTDPITAADQARSARVATFQSGKDNPFVLDSTLIRRAFFPEIVVADEDGPDVAAARLVVVSGNPFTAAVRLRLTLPAPGPVRAEAFDVLGRRVAVLLDGEAAGDVVLELSGAGLAPGIYTVRVATPSGVLTQRLVRAN